MKDCTVAVAQMRIKPNSPETNTVKVIEFIKRASASDADIVVFPEGCIQTESTENLEDFPRYLKRIKAACRAEGIWCILTSYYKSGRKRRNTAFVINRRGKVVHRYNKVRLYFHEGKNVAAGGRNRPVDTEFGKIGIIICYDIEWPEDIRALARKGAWIIFCPTYEADWPNDQVVRAMPLVRAYESKSYFVMANAIAPHATATSTIAEPYRIVKQLVGREGLVIARLSADRIRAVRKQPFIRSLRR